MNATGNILVIDDNAGLCYNLRNILEDIGYHVETANSGAEGLAILKREVVHLTFLDIRLPDVEGTELLATIHALYPDMPVVLMTAYASLDTAVKALNEGAYAYLLKPLDMDLALSVVRRALERLHLQEQERLLTEQLRTLNRAALLITSDLQVERVLQTIADIGCELVRASYACLLLPELNERAVSGISGFFTAGVTPEVRAGMARMFETGNVMDRLAQRAEPLRLDDLAQHPEFIPPGISHPPVTSLLSVPIISHETVLGNICLADKLSDNDIKPFTDTDQQIIGTLAAQAAVAIENARLYEMELRRATELEKTKQELEQELTRRKMTEETRDKLITELQDALAQVKVLRGLLPICMYCKKIRNDEGDWQRIEAYIQTRSEAEFTHGICPDCMDTFCQDMLGD